MFIRNLSLNYLTILPTSVEYGRYKTIYDGILRILCRLYNCECEQHQELLHNNKNWSSKLIIPSCIENFEIAVEELTSPQNCCDLQILTNSVKHTLEEIFSKEFQSDMLFSSMDLVGSMANNLCSSKNSISD